MVANNDPDDLLGPLSVGDLDQEYGDVMLRNHGSWIKSKESREIIMADGLKGTGFPITIMDTAAVAGMTEAKSVRFEVSAEKSIGMAKTNTPSMDLYIEAKGIDLSGKEITRRVIASHPGGQAKCTAFGALLAIKTILSTTKKGFLFLEYLMDLDLAFKEMKDEGMEITFQ
ncbi:hypothetical protein IQ37_15530 [Chryseobacterium piperi]|uniref:Saccharopine dehydrogenase-like C-terminal domain-containing protein n=1 Tax=Chryseobacterium piperi TaxID=558152 RepID=A0A086AWP6_9FLAO|nr:hypothetical protein [Chryseobacterium piperi]ASW73471.1 hypothetical protein CJF12_03650 [Chryseobacterium piperi]KFF21110.1 hypothetical protein IQ37_15530 [Chryseobacterium piperi]